MDCGAQHEKASARIQYFKEATDTWRGQRAARRYLKNLTFYRRLGQDSALRVCHMLGCQTTPPSRHCIRTNRICLTKGKRWLLSASPQQHEHSVFVFLKQKASVQHSETPSVPAASPRFISDAKTARRLPPSFPPGPAQGAPGPQAGRSAATPAPTRSPAGQQRLLSSPAERGTGRFPRTGVQRFQPARRRAVTEPRQRAAGPRGRRLRPSVPRPRLKQCRAAAFPSSRLGVTEKAPGAAAASDVGPAPRRRRCRPLPPGPPGRRDDAEAGARSGGLTPRGRRRKPGGSAPPLARRLERGP